MHIEKVIAVNWGQIESREYYFNQLELLTGSTGSGKTTLADAIQTVMTATKAHLFEYNPGQDESNQHGKHGKSFRTLESYIVGADESGYARPEGAHGLVAIVFTPSPGEEGQPFTAVVSASAHLEETPRKDRMQRVPRLEDLRLFILEGAQAELADFATPLSQTQLNVRPIEQVIHLRDKYPRVEEFKNDKGGYLARLYGLMRGQKKVSREEAEQAARSFSRFMAYKPIEDVDQFVKREVLIEYDQSQQVTHIAEMMRNMAELKAEAERLSANTERLDQCRHYAEMYVTAWREMHHQKLWLAMQEAFDVRQKIDNSTSLLHQFSTDYRELFKKIEGYKETLARLEEDKQRVQKQRSEHAVAHEKDRLEKERETSVQALLNSVASLRVSFNGSKEVAACVNKTFEGYAELRQHAGQLDAFPPLQQAVLTALGELTEDVITQAKRGQTLLVALMQCSSFENSAESDALIASLKGIDDRLRRLSVRASTGEQSIVVLANRLIGEQNGQLEGLKQEKETLRGQIANLEGRGEIPYPENVAAAVATIRRTYPEANPQVLCDLVEMRNPVWQAVIEGYLGMTRFSILVDPAYEAQATTVAKGGKRGPSARVIQGTLARKDAARVSLTAGSIVHEFDVQHPIARAFLVANYNNVNKVEDTEALRHERRGVSKDGFGAASYAMFECALKDGELTFGKAARTRRLKALQNQLKEVEKREGAINLTITTLANVGRSAGKIQPASVEADATAIGKHTADIIHYNVAIASLDTSEIEDLDVELERIGGLIRAASGAKDGANKDYGKLGEKIEQTEKDIDKLEEKLATKEKQIESAREDLLDLAAIDAAVDYGGILLRIEAVLKGGTLTRETQGHILTGAEAVSDLIKSTERQLETRMRNFENAVGEYNQKARALEQIRIDDMPDQAANTPEVHQIVRAGLGVILEQLRAQHDSGLVAALDKLRLAQRDVHSAFTSDFCQMLHNRLQAGERIIRELNTELEVHNFGNATYQFDSEWEPEFKRYYDFFQAVMSIDGLGEELDLFSVNALTDEQMVIRDELIDMLVNSEADIARRKLMEISDYRRYKRYEIYKQPDSGQQIALSTYGTGSGGQLETPSYVIRSASITSAFRHREGDMHLRTVVIDESFAKMDERHARDVLDYLTKVLGFQVIFILPSKSAGPFIDMVNGQIKFAKVPGQVGELKHQILVQEQQYDQSNMAGLWLSHRAAVREAAALEVTLTHPEPRQVGFELGE